MGDSPNKPADDHATDQLPTQASLINKLKDPADALSWAEFFHRYQFVVHGIARKRGLSQHDAEDVVQEVFQRVAKSICNFEAGRRPGSFRAWLFQLTRWRAEDKAHQHRRAGANEEIENHEVEMSCPANQGESLEKEARKHILDVLFHRLEGKVPQKQLQAFRMMVVDEVPVDRVCELFKITRNFAYVLRHRILLRLKEEAAQLPLGDDPPIKPADGSAPPHA